MMAARSRQRRAGLLLAGVLAAVSAASLAEGIYRWTGLDGTVHFGDKPPPGSGAEAVKVYTARDAATAERLGSLSKQAEEQRAARLEAAEASAKQAEDAAKIAAHCHSARDNLVNLQTSTRRQIVNAQGEREFLDEATRQAWIKAAEDEIAKYCK